MEISNGFILDNWKRKEGANIGISNRWVEFHWKPILVSICFDSFIFSWLRGIVLSGLFLLQNAELESTFINIVRFLNYCLVYGYFVWISLGLLVMDPEAVGFLFPGNEVLDKLKPNSKFELNGVDVVEKSPNQRYVRVIWSFALYISNYWFIVVKILKFYE